jgi:hypothetical protein
VASRKNGDAEASAALMRASPVEIRARDGRAAARSDLKFAAVCLGFSDWMRAEAVLEKATVVYPEDSS